MDFELGAVLMAASAVLGSIATLAGVSYKGKNESRKIDVEVQRVSSAADEQESQQAERVVVILRELLQEERTRADKFQANSEKLAEQLSQTKQALFETQAEVKLLRRELQIISDRLANGEEQSKMIRLEKENRELRYLLDGRNTPDKLLNQKKIENTEHELKLPHDKPVLDQDV